MLDKNGDQSGVALRAEVTGVVGEHAVEQLVGVGQDRFGVIGGLAKF